MSHLTIPDFLANDHARLDRMLEQILERESLTPGSAMASELYREFKGGMLLHIRMEETVLLPAARKANSDQPLPIASKLRLDHGAIVALLVPPPNLKILLALQTILKLHNQLEEEPGGAYEKCDMILGPGEAAHIVNELKKLPAVPMAKNLNTALATESAARALERAGFSRSLIEM